VVALSYFPLFVLEFNGFAGSQCSFCHFDMATFPVQEICVRSLKQNNPLIYLSRRGSYINPWFLYLVLVNIGFAC